MTLVDWACQVAETNLAGALPRRWRHVQGVAWRASILSHVVGDDAELLHAAAVLHDVGYAPDLAVTGFHPLDGANYLLSAGAPRRLAALVARHSGAAIEASLRGVQDQVEVFTDERSPVRDALWYCDLTTSPDGTPVSLRKRLSEIETRYGPEDVITSFLYRASDEPRRAVDRTAQRLAAVA